MDNDLLDIFVNINCWLTQEKYNFNFEYERWIIFINEDILSYENFKQIEKKVLSFSTNKYNMTLDIDKSYGLRIGVIVK